MERMESKIFLFHSDCKHQQLISKFHLQIQTQIFHFMIVLVNQLVRFSFFFLSAFPFPFSFLPFSNLKPFPFSPAIRLVIHNNLEEIQFVDGIIQDLNVWLWQLNLPLQQLSILALTLLPSRFFPSLSFFF